MSTEAALPALTIGVCVATLAFGLLLQLVLHSAHTKYRWVPLPTEGLLWLLLGVLLSLLLEADFLPQSAAEIVHTLDADFESFFFQALLPPIIFRSGWALADGLDGLSLTDLLRHIRPAVLLAFLGTLVCTLVCAAWQRAFAAVGATYPFSWLQCLLLSVALSATDTVCVLSLLREMRVQASLYATVFGESILNDAVTIVLFRAMASYMRAVNAGTQVREGWLVLTAAGDFLWGFLGACLIGSAIGVCVTLLFKFGSLSRAGESGLAVERALLALTPFLAYMAAEASGASGVVSALFCGVIFAALAQRNVDPSSSAFAGQLYSTAGSLAEYLTFVFLGVACTEMGGPVFAQHWPAAVVLLCGCALGRAASVALCVTLSNRVEPANERISWRMAVVVWFSGLRGGVAFALATAAAGVVLDKDAAAVFPVAAVFVAAVTLPVISFATAPLITALGLQAKEGVEPPLPPALPARLRPVSVSNALARVAERAYAFLVVEAPPGHPLWHDGSTGGGAPSVGGDTGGGSRGGGQRATGGGEGEGVVDARGSADGAGQEGAERLGRRASREALMPLASGGRAAGGRGDGDG